MSNTVHYLIEPARHEDLPRIMHWLNWYSAMCFNRMLKRTGHFWEQRYHSSAFPTNNRKRALNTLRYIFKPIPGSQESRAVLSTATATTASMSS